MSKFNERFPIGSRWVDPEGDQHVVLLVDGGDGTVTTAFLRDGAWDTDTWNYLHEEFEPYQEPVRVPDFERYVWVDARGDADGSARGPGDREAVATYRVGVRDNTPFIEEVTS